MEYSLKKSHYVFAIAIVAGLFGAASFQQVLTGENLELPITEVVDIASYEILPEADAAHLIITHPPDPPVTGFDKSNYYWTYNYGYVYAGSYTYVVATCNAGDIAVTGGHYYYPYQNYYGIDDWMSLGWWTWNSAGGNYYPGGWYVGFSRSTGNYYDQYVAYVYVYTWCYRA